jgi:serine/threonine-protein kinase HipA
MRKAEIKYNNIRAGFLSQDDEGYHFQYDSKYLEALDTNKSLQAISATFPMKTEAYVSKTLFAFFDGLIPEGWLLDIAEKNWKLNPRDRMGLLLACCNDCIGAVSVHNTSE